MSNERASHFFWLLVLAVCVACLVSSFAGCGGQQYPAHRRSPEPAVFTLPPSAVAWAARLGAYEVSDPSFEVAWTMAKGPGLVPRVFVIPAEGLTCEGDRFVRPGLGCLSGVTETDGTIVIAHWGVVQVLPHELNHLSKGLRTGDADPLHGGFSGADVLAKWDRDVIGPIEDFFASGGW